MGDELLDKTANTLRKLLNQHIFDAAKPELFIYKEYHVEAFNDSEVKPTYRNIIRKVRNNLTIAMNKFPSVLPSYLVIIVSNSYIHDPTFVEFELKTILKRVLNDVTRLLASRRDQIKAKNVNIMGHTEVYMMRPLPKPARALSLKSEYSFKNTRRHFNQMIDRLARTFNFKPLNIDEVTCAQRALFEKNGDLSDYGMERMWVSISDFIKNRDEVKHKALEKCSVTMRSAGTQTDASEFLEKGGNESFLNNSQYDTYYTADQTGNRDRDRWEQQARFDNYHTRYDRDDYQGYYQHDSY